MKTPAIGELPQFRPPPFERTRLSNGLDVIVAPKKGMPIVDIQLVVRGGASRDDPAHAGRASMTAEMIDEGTADRSAIEISQLVEQLGAELDVRAGADAFFLSAHGLSSRFDDLLGLLSEIALQPSFPRAEFERKHEERVHMLKQERDEARIVAMKALSRAIYGTEHPFGRPISGTVDSIESLTLEEIVRCYETQFSPAVSHVLVVGDVGVDDAVSALERAFGAWQPVEPENGRAPSASSFPGIHVIHKSGAPQSEVRFGHRGVPRGTPDYFSIIVMNTILGGSFKSRLNSVLREEKGFTYGATSSFTFRREAGSFTGGAAVHTEATAETVALSLHEIEGMRGGVTAEELTRARNYLSLGLIRNFETTSDIIGHLAEIALYDLPADYIARYSENVGAVNAEDVARAAETYLQPEQLSVLVVGDSAQVMEPLQQLGRVVDHWEAD